MDNRWGVGGDTARQVVGRGMEDGKRKRFMLAAVKALGRDTSCLTELDFWRKSICFL